MRLMTSQTESRTDMFTLCLSEYLLSQFRFSPPVSLWRRPFVGLIPTVPYITRISPPKVLNKSICQKAIVAPDRMLAQRPLQRQPMTQQDHHDLFHTTASKLARPAQKKLCGT